MSDPAQPPIPPSGWTPPSAPPFGGPVGSAAAPAPGAAPAEAPDGSAAGPGAPAEGPAASPTGVAKAAAGPAIGRRSVGRSRTLGVVAMAAGLAAAVGATVAGGIAAWQIGLGAGSEMITHPFTGDFDWSLLSPVRDAVRAGEIAFWVGTVLGLWALVQGLIAIVRDNGRGFAIAAVLLAALGPVAFFAAVQVALTAGLTAGSGFGG